MRDSAIPGLNGSLHLIKNGVDISEIDATDNIAEELECWKRQGAFIIGYIGRLIRSKGVEALFNALVRVDSVGWRLAIVGDGGLRNELEQAVLKLGLGDRVKFFGFQEKPLAFLKGFDLFVLPSRTEGMPRCLMESMAAGVPVIASDIPGCRTLVSHGQTGFLFPVDDKDALTAGIEALAADEVTRKSFAANGREVIVAQFSAERMANEYQDLYFILGEAK